MLSLSPILNKNFLTESECDQLVNWIVEYKTTDFFMETSHPGCLRLTTRGLQFQRVPFPDVAFKIREKIISHFNFNNYEIKYPDFSDGMVASFGVPPDECSIHTDPIYYDGFITYHCVCLLTQPDKGGTPIIDGQQYPMDKGDVILYPVSHLEHGTTLLEGNTPRLLWIFGFCLKPKNV